MSAHLLRLSLVDSVIALLTPPSEALVPFKPLLLLGCTLHFTCVAHSLHFLSLFVGAGDAPVPNNPSYSWTALSASGWGDFFAVAVDHIRYGDSRLAVPQSVFSKGYRTVLDSGTTFIYLVSPAYKAFAAAAQAAARVAGLQQTTDGYGDICVSNKVLLLQTMLVTCSVQVVNGR
jgi:hypothetical protein